MYAARDVGIVESKLHMVAPEVTQSPRYLQRLRLATEPVRSGAFRVQRVSHG